MGWASHLKIRLLTIYFLLILVDLSLMNVLGDLDGKFDYDKVKVLVSKDTDEDANNYSNLYI